MKRYIRQSKTQVTEIKRLPHEPVVQPNLGCTPTDMQHLASRGIAISANTLGQHFYDGEKDITFDIPIEQQKHVDIAEIWQAEEQAKQKLGRISKKFKYGQ